MPSAHGDSAWSELSPKRRGAPCQYASFLRVLIPKVIDKDRELPDLTSDG